MTRKDKRPKIKTKYERWVILAFVLGAYPGIIGLFVIGFALPNMPHALLFMSVAGVYTVVMTIIGGWLVILDAGERDRLIAEDGDDWVVTRTWRVKAHDAAQALERTHVGMNEASSVSRLKS